MGYQEMPVSFQVHVTNELRVSGIDDPEATLNAAVEAVSAEVVEIGLDEPFVFGEITSSASWTLRVEFAAQVSGPEDLLDQTHEISQRLLRAIGFPPNLGVAISQSAELVPA